MGRRDRERIARIRAGEELAISPQTRDRATQVGVSTVKRLSADKQVQFLANSLHSGHMTPASLRKALEENAPVEMCRGADKLIKKNRPVTVEALLEDYHKDALFRATAAEVGLDEMWFTTLAEKEYARRTNNGC